MAAAGHACGGCRETIASADCLCERHSGIRMPELTKEGIFHCVYAALNDPTYRFADLDAAASYLGVTKAALRTGLSGGSTLAEIAKAKGKSVDGLKDALVAAAKADIAQAVKDGRLTAARHAEILADLGDRIDGLVNGDLGPRGGHGPHGSGGPLGDA